MVFFKRKKMLFVKNHSMKYGNSFQNWNITLYTSIHYLHFVMEGYVNYREYTKAICDLQNMVFGGFEWNSFY